MRRRDVLEWIGATTAGLWSARVAAQAPQADGPRAAIELTRIDLGVVALGADPEVRFTVRNEGRAPLTLVPGRVAPGLRIVSVDSPVPPGAAGVATLQIETFRAGATTDWTIPLTTNDPARDTIVLQVHADVRTYILVTPPTARFSYVQYEREGGTTHLVGAAGDPAFRITRVESPYAFIDVGVAAATDAQRPEGVEGPLWQVTLTIRKHAEVGPLAGVVVLHTSHPNQPRAWLPVGGFVRPLVGVTPPEATLPSTPAGDTPAEVGALAVTNFGEAPLELTRVETTLPGVDVEVAPVQVGRRWRVQLKVRRAAGDGPLDGALVITTSRADVPPVRVPLRRR